LTARLVALAFDAAAPNELARFWAQALRWSIGRAGGAAVELVPTDATSFNLLFRPGAHEKVGQNRIHLDLTTSSLDDHLDTVAELLTIGATHIDIGQDPDDTHVVLADPEGNEFCIIEPSNRFLAGCPRLGESTATAPGASGVSSARRSDGRWSGTRTRRRRSRHPTAPDRRSPGAVLR
jgi:hypothetical protein